MYFSRLQENSKAKTDKRFKIIKYNNDWEDIEEPFRAILLHSPGRKPWVNHRNTFIEPQRGGTISPQKQVPNTRVVSAAPTELNLLLSVFTQGCISGFALI